jgi:hypothetical protein
MDHEHLGVIEHQCEPLSFAPRRGHGPAPEPLDQLRRRLSADGPAAGHRHIDKSLADESLFESSADSFDFG